MACQDCLHFEVCDDYQRRFANCNHFKDRSRFIEMPCVVGEKIYTIDKGYICDEQIINVDCFVNFNTFVIRSSNSIFSENALGKTVFFTREEAEKALKERE